MSNFDTCSVCDEPFPDEYGKFDDKAPVYADTYAYHLACENEVITEVCAEV